MAAAREVAYKCDVAISERKALEEQIKAVDGQLIGSRIRQARAEADLSHDALGALLGGRVTRTGRRSRAVSRQHLIKLERGQHRPRPEMLKRLAIVLERPPEWFLSEAVPDKAPRRTTKNAV